MLAILRVIRELFQHRCQLSRLFTGMHHGAKHIPKRLGKLGHGAGERVALRYPGTYLQQNSLDPAFAGLLCSSLQAFIQR